ncbi:uncharacterized protein LOC131038921 [Cryptomeria japonica]|uniref:uncharacterized protein LOC131038921 n=1 Tax=Cryptomeria japonica TaxID=3369 RepID=UPI0025ABD8DC|nr:uncharacterized protein LOC131038921 [Cryptomeria japonica]
MASAKNSNSVIGINLNEDNTCNPSEGELKTSEDAESSRNLLMGIKKTLEEAGNSCNPLMGVQTEAVRHPGPMVVSTGQHDRKGHGGVCADLNEISEEISEDSVLSEVKRVKEAGSGASIVTSSAKLGDVVNGSVKFGDVDNGADALKATLSGKADEEQDLGIKARCIALQNYQDLGTLSGQTTELCVTGEGNHIEEPKGRPIEEPFDQHGDLNIAKSSNLSPLEETSNSIQDPNRVQEKDNSSEIPFRSDAPMKRCTVLFASATTNVDPTQGSSSAQDATKSDGEKHSVQLPYEAKASSPNCIPKEHKFSVGDLVWCKVKYHPWWPGQIFDPSDASEAARQLQKKDRLLVANFGDQTFAWCELSNLKPFRENFAELAKLSTGKVFCNGVDKALNELARQEQFGLTCSCLSGKTQSTLKNKLISNGLREGAVVDNHRRFSLAATAFDPWKLLTYVRELAESPFTDNNLDITTFRAQVHCFYAGQRHFAFGETSSEVLLKHASISENQFATTKNVKSNNSSPGKHRQSSNGRQSSRKKKKLFGGSQGYESEQDDLPLNNSTETRKRAPKEKEGWYGRKLSQSTSKKQRKNEYIFASGGYRKGAKGWQEKQNMHTASPITENAQGDTKKVPKAFKIGECIRKIASQLTGSPPIIKSVDPAVEKTLEDREKAKLESMENIPRSPSNWIKSPLPFKKDFSIKESLFELFLVAQSPIYFLGENDIFSRVTNIFLRFRGEAYEKDSVYPSYRRASKSSSKLTVSPRIDDSDDSNWSDTTNASKPKGHRLRRRRKKVESQAKDSENKPKRRVRSSDSTPSKKVKKLKDNIRSPDTTLSKELPHSAANNLTDSPQESPTALFMKFPPGFAFPSETELKEMFVHYGQISETQFFSDSGCAQVIFRKCSDAEAAFYGATANKVFGPATVSFRLRYLTSRRKTDTVQTEDPREAEIGILSEGENTSRNLGDVKENEGQPHASGVSVVEAVGASN